ncbi:MAG: 3-isopropylmalate dehydratase small subunit [Candidatus Saelkia tenebricola]|nr:3-isopropylmalate dehydratase small subunit [Candidatus Saelkia tenebricola]
MKIKGKVWKFGDDVDTDLIIPAKYLVTTDAKELGSHCLENIKQGFPERVNKGDIIVAGKNFGSGSSREHAPLAIKGAGVSAVLAESFARIFSRNAINIGLPIIEIEEMNKFKDYDLIEIDFINGRVRNLSQDKEYKFQKYPEFLQNIIRAGGLMKWAQRMV